MSMKKRTFVAVVAFALACAGASAQNAAAGKYKIGDKGPGGGIVFYYSEEGFPVQDSDDASAVICHYLECSRKEMRAQWCYNYCNISTLSGIGAGKLNTARIVNHEHEEPLTPSNCAAYACAVYATKTTKAGEWYLPSMRELWQIYYNLREGKKKKIHSKATYWASEQSEIGCDDAWWLNFNTGMSCCCYRKDYSLAIRAVRAF